MAAITIAVADVTSATTTSKLVVQCGESGGVTAGQVVYKATTTTPTGLWMKALNNGTAEQRGVGLDPTTQMGVALCAGLLNGWFVVQPLGTVELSDAGTGALLAVGTRYYLHSTAGGIGVRSEVTTGQYVVDLGYATTIYALSLSINSTGLASA